MQRSRAARANSARDSSGSFAILMAWSLAVHRRCRQATRVNLAQLYNVALGPQAGARRRRDVDGARHHYPARSRPKTPATGRTLPQGEWRSDLHGRRQAGAGQADHRQGQEHDRGRGACRRRSLFPALRPLRRTPRDERLGRRLFRQEDRSRHDAGRDGLDGEEGQEGQDRRPQGCRERTRSRRC